MATAAGPLPARSARSRSTASLIPAAPAVQPGESGLDELGPWLVSRGLRPVGSLKLMGSEKAKAYGLAVDARAVIAMGSRWIQRF